MGRFSFKLGMPYRDVTAKLGKPDRSVRYDDMFTVEYKREQIRVSMTQKDMRVWSVTVLGSRYHFADGIKVGTQQTDVTKKFGAPDGKQYSETGKSWGWVYINKGLIFGISNNKVKNIMVAQLPD